MTESIYAKAYKILQEQSIKNADEQLTADWNKYVQDTVRDIAMHSIPLDERIDKLLSD